MAEEYVKCPTGESIEPFGVGESKIIKSRLLQSSDIESLREGTTRAYLMSWLAWTDSTRRVKEAAWAFKRSPMPGNETSTWLDADRR